MFEKAAYAFPSLPPPQRGRTPVGTPTPPAAGDVPAWYGDVYGVVTVTAISRWFVVHRAATYRACDIESARVSRRRARIIPALGTLTSGQFDDGISASEEVTRVKCGADVTSIHARSARGSTSRIETDGRRLRDEVRRGDRAVPIARAAKFARIDARSGGK